MIPYKDVETIEEVKKLYPAWYGEYLYKKSKVREFIEEERKNIKHTSLRGKKPSEMKSMAEARGVYRFLWCMEHNMDQMVKFGWDKKDINILIDRMKRHGYDPYSVTEDTVSEFIESLPGYGHPEKTINGKTFRVYSPKGNE